MTAAAVTHDVPDDVKSFINVFVTSYAAWDIVTFFFDTRGMVRADDDEIAMSIGRDKDEITPVLACMEHAGILSTQAQQSKVLYATNTQCQWLEAIRHFISFTASREGRLKTIYMITEKRFYQN